MKGPSTSAVKDLKEARFQWAAERAGLTSEPDFNSAAQAEQAELAPPDDRSRGSKMVREDAPRIHNVPPPEWRKEVDAESFAVRWSDEQIEAMAEQYKREKIAELRAERDSAQRENAESDNDKGQQRDRGDDYEMER